MYFNKEKFFDISRKDVLNPSMTAIWDDMGIGVAVVNGDGICEYMNPIQRKADGFRLIDVVGEHITKLYVPYELECIPTIECLRKAEPVLKKSYFYKTTNNFLASTVSDFFPLFERGKKDGVIAFTIWTGTSPLVEHKSRPAKSAAPIKKTYDYYTFDSLVGEDEALLDVLVEARAAAKSPSHVMIWGESGTGKEVFAQAIHAESARRNQPLIAENCAAIPENLLEAILFGTAKGAYTDAGDRPGLFEEADGGTLLLDELNSMPLGLQAKLLRVLQEKRVRRLGSRTEIPVDVRVISILNESPLNAVGQGILRSDLFYRLAVVGIAVPPLRHRKKDIPLLMRTFIESSEQNQGGKPIGVDPEILQMFFDYDWPGNIRELLHVIEGSLALLGERSSIERCCLPLHFREACKAVGSAQGPKHMESLQRAGETFLTGKDYFDYSGIKRNSVVPLKNCMQEYEAQCIRNVLEVTGGNVAKAARILQITGAGLRYKIKLLDVEID
ncbi:sigma-54-dependent Fis family transcriptional regulator [Maridesulfovibrio ferrireducens]|uniref:sigma-54 interaction domain-containing protein n=1 Tax=Maridesulfovibrio ferrireducens TaxID=246191 RepID=UPI0026F146BC|nr:sigma 54-interacting transcriptional regulator [Maridesulfovibrio ferrireducens]